MILDGVKPNDGEVLSFLMVGQSNMAGRGDLGDVPPIINDHCRVLRIGYWQRMDEPINPDRSTAGVSLATSFADDLANHSKQYIGLIPCAYGGTSLRRWMPGEILFEHAVFMGNLAKKSSKLGGIIWHQGESNCATFDKEFYRTNFIQMITALRKALEAEELPLILGEVSEHITEKWGCGDNPPKFNALLHELAQELPHCAVASSEGLTLRSDGIHFDAPSCREMGHRYFEKYIELTEGIK